MTKSVLASSLCVQTQKKVKSEAEIRLESEKNLKDLNEILRGKKYTKRKKSLLKKQILDLNEKLRTDLPIITEEKLERFEGINAIDQEMQKIVNHPENRKPSCKEDSLSLEKAAAGEQELQAGGDLDVGNVFGKAVQK